VCTSCQTKFCLSYVSSGVALQHVTKDIAGMLWWGLFPGPTAGYCAADYATAVQLLLASPYGAVDQVVLLSKLPGGLPALQALIRANLLALRLFSGRSGGSLPCRWYLIFLLQGGGGSCCVP